MPAGTSPGTANITVLVKLTFLPSEGEIKRKCSKAAIASDNPDPDPSALRRFLSATPFQKKHIGSASAPSRSMLRCWSCNNPWKSPKLPRGIDRNIAILESRGAAAIHSESSRSHARKLSSSISSRDLSSFASTTNGELALTL
eukprot:150283-Rhodomonas_salina.2